MRKRFARWGNNLLLLGCAAVCLWCVGTKFQAWAQEQWGDALLFAAGMQAQPASSPSGAGASPSHLRRFITPPLSRIFVDSKGA